MSVCENLRKAIVVTATALLSSVVIPAFATTPPGLTEVRKIATEHLRTLRDYEPGDLISRGDVEPIFNELLAQGVPSSDIAEGLYDDFVTDNSLLVRSLRTESGRRFMRQVSGFPGAYDRLERLSWIPAGQDILRELVEKPDGATLFKAMLEPAGMQATARHLAADPRGKNYSLPTGHIHTAAQLMKRLETIFPTKTEPAKKPVTGRR